MKNQNRFQDQNLRLTDFQQEVLVVCTQCAKKAIVKVNYEEEKVRLFCENCGYNKERPTTLTVFAVSGNWKLPAHQYFGTALWLQHSFKTEVFWAYNYEHLSYLENYIAAELREHKYRSHFTLLEKLPKFYHEAKNRESLLKIIKKLKKL